MTQHLRLGNIQGLRGLAVLAVVLSHLMSVEHKYAGDRLLGDAFSIGLSGVDLFFAISGFVMVYVAWQSPKGLHTSLSFLFARIGRIYPLYWLVSLAVLIVWLWRPDLVFASNEDVSLWHSFALLPYKYPPLLAVGWTLIHEMYFYLVFAALLLLPSRFRAWGLSAWAVLVLWGLVMQIGLHSPVLRLLSNPLSFEFLGGALAAFAVSRFSGKGWQGTLLLGFVLFIAACLLSLHIGLEFWDNWPRAASFTPAISLIVYGAVGAEQKGRIFSRFFIWLGDQSYALYLTHVLSLSAAGRLWHLVAQEGPWDNLIMLPVLMALALFVGDVVHRYVEQPLLVLFKKWRKKLF
jgi:peptidoglycan/LPS O-acetylase OafA/YrhL